MANPQRSSRRTLSRRRPRDITAGTILWLPPKRDIDGSLIVALGLEEGCYEHPFLVLSLDSTGKEVVGLIVTSLKGKDLRAKYPHRKFRLQHLPIYPSAVHPDLDMQLFLKNNRKLRKNSYVKTEKLTFERGALVEYANNGTRFSLTADSFEFVLAYIKKSPAYKPIPIIDEPLPPLHLHLLDQRSDKTLATDAVLSSSSNTPPVRMQAAPISVIVRPSHTTFSNIRNASYPSPAARESWLAQRSYGIGVSAQREPLLPLYKPRYTEPEPEPEPKSNALATCSKLIKSTYTAIATCTAVVTWTCASIVTNLKPHLMLITFGTLVFYGIYRLQALVRSWL